MKKIICFLSAMLGSLALLATGALADDVQVSMDFTVTGASTGCGSGGTSACVDTLQAKFIWNNSTDAVVGTPSVSITGPLDYGTLTVVGPVATSVTGVNAIETTFTDPGGDFASFGIFFSGSNLPTGTYNYDTGAPLAGEAKAVDGKCVSTTDMCLTFFPNHGTTFDGTVVVTSVAPSTVPEPGTLGLLGTGLVGIAGLFRRRFLS